MIREASARGTGTIVCTPHLLELDERFIDRVRKVYRELTAEVWEHGIPVRLVLGFEVDITVAALSDIDTVRTLCIGGSDAEQSADKGQRGQAVLIEMPYSGWPPFLEETLFRLTTAGLVPILAHPERNDRVQRSPDVLAACLNAGAVAQGTAGSLSSMFRKQSLKTFQELLARGWFGLLASDAHSKPEYTWTLEPLFAELGKRLSPADRVVMTELNPARVLEGKRPFPLPKDGRSDGSWWFV
jgi:protein-tyrosine phosphatase